MNATIRLFKAVPITKKTRENAGEDLLKTTVKRGFIFSPEVVANYSGQELMRLVDVISKEVGLTGEKMNASFHKSWAKVRDASIEQLVVEQIFHYITTYGYEAMGIYDKDTVYVPPEAFSLPKVKMDRISLVVIKGYTKDEIKAKLVAFLGSGIALKEDTKKDAIDIATGVMFSEEEILAIKNKEVRIALYDLLDRYPQDPVEFLRFLVYKATDRTLLIKSPALIAEIKSKSTMNMLGVLHLLTKYEKSPGLDRLAEVFYRFKPLFLALRTSKRLKFYVNRIRKMAITCHKPMPEDFLNEITAKIIRGDAISEHRFMEELARVNTFRKIRLAYALKYRTTGPDSILYRIRNGKSYATEFKLGVSRRNRVNQILETVVEAIVEDVRPNVSGKKVFFPDNIHYALPATEKQFTGDFPSGTYVTVDKEMLFGVHWTNMENKGSGRSSGWGYDNGRVDLDLSLIKCDGGKIGWDADYRTGSGDIMFSGDMTDAPKPNGASELFYVGRQKASASLMMVNFFNHGDGDECPFEIIVAKQKISKLEKNHMVNPNNVVCIAKSKIVEKQKVLGLLVTTPEECRFYFAETALGNTITSYSGADYVQQARKYLFNFYENTISLYDILARAGALFVTNPKDADIDLSYERIERDSIIKLVTKQNETKTKVRKD